MIIKLIITFLIFVVLLDDYYVGCQTVESSMPIVKRPGQFRSAFCKYVCLKDASLGGTYCNCDKVCDQYFDK
jgi:hypothetical protein